MAKDKEKRQVNPATAALKKQKAVALKKGKAQVLAQRNERLAHRNPDRLQRQIDELKQAGESRQLRPKDKQHLEQLEKDLQAINKARDGLGDRAPKFGGPRRDFGDGHGSSLGKRRRGSGERWKNRDSSVGSETDEDVRDISMPTDHENEPPIPRRPRVNQNARHGASQNPSDSIPQEPVKAQTTYSSAPQIRDLKKEAVSRFMPTAVAARKRMAQGQGKLLEPEDADKLEREGYLHNGSLPATSKEAADVNSSQALEEEEERFRRELHGVAGDELKSDNDGAKQTLRTHQATVEEEVDDEN